MSYDIPANLSLYSAIYEYRVWILLPVLAVALGLIAYSLFRGQKIYFFYAVLFPVIFFLVNIGCIWCGWHYRMELRERYAVEHISNTADMTDCVKPANINRMPPAIRAEYAKNDYHPRYRDIKASTACMFVATPILFGLQVVIWFLVAAFRQQSNKEVPDKKTAENLR